tara:strand:+ start:1838 stop:2683 length:846 start_codon:yes stop_codon:yes gene_type:complete
MGLLGAHVSVAGGVYKAPERGKDISANAIQIFTANQNQWFPKQPSEEDCEKFQIEMKNNRIQSCVSHASYLLNMGSPEMKKLNMTRKAFTTEIDRCNACDIPFVVFHPGAHMKSGEDGCLKRISESLNYVMNKRPDNQTTILIENTAGQGTVVGYKFEHLAEIIDGVENKGKIGVCFDTQHGFAAGYDLRTEEGWNETFQKFDEIVALEWLKAFHINDSKKELGTRVDRHESLGKGYLNEETFKCLVNDERFDGLPMLLETPVKDYMEYKEELKYLRKLKK